MLCNRRRIVQSASVRNATGGTDPSSLRNPTSRISPISEDTGVMPDFTPAGSARTAGPNRSCTICRAR